jgi:multidrug efflux pump subunit AcrB
MKERVIELEEFLAEYDEVTQTTAAIGGGHVRFMLSYKPEKHYDNYANLIISTEKPEDVVTVIKRIREDATEHFPDLLFTPKRYSVGPQTIGAIELRIYGSDPIVLRQLAEDAKEFMRKTPGAESVRDDWLERSKVIRPKFNEINARRLGITKKSLDQAILANFSGRAVGTFKEGTDVLPVISRPPEGQRVTLGNLAELNIWSPVKQGFIPIAQVVDGFETTFEDALIVRRDRVRTITAMADYDVTSEATSASVRRLMLPAAEEFERNLPTGYTMEWGGKHEKSTNAKASVFSTIPGGYLVMFILTILLFNSVKKGLVIWFVVPLSVIGVISGLLAFNMPFTFMALLGALSLTGMMCRNGIVLVDQIGIYQASGADNYKSIFDGAVSRLRPVALTAIAAILGMIPLLQDSFFAAMAGSMMVGLAIATFLILLAVPVFYMLIYRIKYRPLAEIEAEGSLE